MEMTSDERHAFEQLIKTLENAAGLIDNIVTISLKLLEGARASMDDAEASELNDLLADAGIRAGEFRNVAQLSRSAIRGR
jgi:hypothetical protein